MAKLVEQTYGEALFQTAMEENQVDAFLEEVELIQTVLKQNPEWDRLMKHPKISKQEKVEIMKGAFTGRISKEMTGFLELILVKERYGQLQAVFQYFTEKVKEEKRSVRPMLPHRWNCLKSVRRIYRPNFLVPLPI